MQSSRVAHAAQAESAQAEVDPAPASYDFEESLKTEHNKLSQMMSSAKKIYRKFSSNELTESQILIKVNQQRKK